jgi:quinol monooxygenase YgiN
VFQSVFDPDKLVLLELWKDQAALDAHAKLHKEIDEWLAEFPALDARVSSSSPRPRF